MKLKRASLSKKRQSGGFLGRLPGQLLETGLTLLKNILKPLTESIFIPLGLTTALSATDADIQKKICGSGLTTLMILNEEIVDFLKIYKTFEESGLLIKSVTNGIKNEAKEQKGAFLNVILGTLGPDLLGNLLICKE